MLTWALIILFNPGDSGAAVEGYTSSQKCEAAGQVLATKFMWQLPKWNCIPGPEVKEK